MKKLLSLFILLCCYANAALANENVFSLSSYDFKPGVKETIYVHMNVSEAYGGFQFDLYLPEGVSIVTKGKEKPQIYEEGPWGEDDVTLVCSQRSNGSYRFIEYANVNADKPQAGNGYVIEMNVETSADAPAGVCKVEFKDVSLSTVDGTDVELADLEYEAQIMGTFSISASSSDEAKGSVEIVGGGEKVEAGTEITVTAIPADGYDFVNWTSSDTEVSTDNPYRFTASQNIALVGNFKAKKYTITYMVDDKVYAEAVYEYGAEITPVEDPVKENDEDYIYHFARWENLPAVMPASDIVVYAVFDKTSGIGNVLSAMEEASTIYGIDGRYIGTYGELMDGSKHIPTGIYINNGKKVLIRR